MEKSDLRKLAALTLVGIMMTALLSGCLRSTGSVEALLGAVNSVPPNQTMVELFVPDHLTLRGKEVSHDIAMAVIADKLLARGFFPAGSEQRSGGRLYRYQKK